MESAGISHVVCADDSSPMVSTIAVQWPDIDRVLSELKECLTAEISSGRRQGMGNNKRQSESFNITLIDVDSTPSAR